MSVGISFGSATSGDGFDVSTTVASVVANMQLVENPWTSQLTSLTAENTALTDIGTDLSSLSSALSSLTDYQGVMAEKEGSSSDQSIISLSSAAATATAGTHTVYVNQIAQTSSDYSDSITSSDTLSGALTIQVGSGAATVVPVGSGDTLSSYAAAINAADVGVTASVISDTSGTRLSLVSQTSGADGQITITQGGSVSESTATTTTASATLSSTTAGATNTFTLGSSSDLLSGTLSYSLSSGASGSVDLGSTPLSLDDTVTALNKDSGFSGAGLTASVSNDKLVITATDTGTSGVSLSTSSSSLTTTTPAATYGVLTDATTPIATAVTSTATAAATNTFNFPSSSSTVTGTLSYKLSDGTTESYDIGDTGVSLSTLAADLNKDTTFNQTNGLTASVSGNQLVITASNTDTAGVTIDTTASSMTSTLGINTGTTAQNAELSVDGISIDSASNTVSTAIPGVTFQILSADKNTPVTVEIVNNNTAVESAFETFVSDYNTVLGDITTQEGTDASGNAEPLYGNTLIAQIQSSLSQALTSGSSSGSINNLYQLGISVTSSGKLSLDVSTLDSTLNTNYSDVVGFLQNTGSFGKDLASTLSNMSSTNTTGSIYLELASNTSLETTLHDEITTENATIATESSSLTTELNSANETLQAIPEQLKEINELYSAITGYSVTS